MSHRRFDGGLVRRARRIADLTQAELAARLGVSEAAAANWEAARSRPGPEKLPAIARELGVDLDELFPRDGLRDLGDVRCDAGLSQKEAAKALGTRSESAVRKAESGKRRLADAYVPGLAEVYGVTVAALLAAQERSFGHAVAEPGAPRSEPAPTPTPPEGGRPAGTAMGIAERIAFLIERSDPGRDTSDAALALRGNTRIGRPVLTAGLVAELRSGARTGASEEEFEALTLALDAPPLFLSGEDEEVDRIVSAARLLTSGFTGMAARGDGGRLTPQLLDFINETVARIQSGLPTGQENGTRPERDR
ncbi:helix-turn-helix transcriptional regulator [Streptomyces sp. NPDC089799]|uniref:helix-turn-helix domain-containing protein n=1 Tax=Streptomyces sp. NPDC089799 TaxID=3155066 RepID=UPI0034470712